jgi:uncharacterized protein (UPF0335 family)
LTNGSEAALRAYVDRIMRVMDEADKSKEDLKELYVEIKSAGFDVKLLREAVALRRRFESAGTFDEYMQAREAYLDAVGLVSRFEPAEKKDPAFLISTNQGTFVDLDELAGEMLADPPDITWNEPMDEDDLPPSLARVKA